MHGQKPNNEQSKKPYKTPGLVTYGKLKDLTTGGSGALVENKPNQTNRKP